MSADFDFGKSDTSDKINKIDFCYPYYFDICFDKADRAHTLTV